MTHCAPQWILRASLKYCGISSRSCRLNGDTAQPMKKFVLGKRSGFAVRPGDFQPLVHRAEHGDQAHRIQVEHRQRLPLETRRRVIAGQRQDVVKPLRRVTPGGGFDAVAIEVLAGEVDDELRAPWLENIGDPIRRQHRVAAGIVGDGNPRDPRVGRQRLAQLDELRRLIGFGDATCRHQFGTIHKASYPQYFAER